MERFKRYSSVSMLRINIPVAGERGRNSIAR